MDPIGDAWPVRFLLLMPWGRVGSNLLLNILNQSRCCKTANESFNDFGSAAEQLAWYEDFYELGKATPSAPWIGCKQNLRAIAEPERLIERLSADGVRLIRLRRDNLVKVTISQIRAEAFAKQTLAEKGRARYALEQGGRGLGRQPIDVALFLARLKTMRKYHEALMSLPPLIGGAGPLVLDVEYDEIYRDLPATVERVRRFLDLPRSRYSVKFGKATSDNLAESVENLEELRQALAGTPYAAMLDRHTPQPPPVVAVKGPRARTLDLEVIAAMKLTPSQVSATTVRALRRRAAGHRFWPSLASGRWVGVAARRTLRLSGRLKRLLLGRAKGAM